MKLKLIFILLTITTYGQEVDKTYPKHVGDLNLYTKEIRICDSTMIFQYYQTSKGFQYKGDKIEIIKQFKEKYHSKNIPKEDKKGYITIRFLVNCEGKTGLFRIEEMDMNYSPIKFDSYIVNQLLDITKSLDGWGIGEYKGKTCDYYQYLTFKLENYNLLEILP